MTRILCIDPGSTNHGASVLDWDGTRVSYVRGGHAVGLGALHNEYFGEPYDSTILEVIEGYAFRNCGFKVKDMVLTARNEGRIIEMLDAVGTPPMQFSAGTMRGHFCRSEHASDKQVAAVVEDLVQNAPVAMRKAERKHVYDACLYGCYGLVQLGARLKLSPDGEAALLKARGADQLKANAKRAKTKAKR
jgi:hypothetical protein